MENTLGNPYINRSGFGADPFGYSGKASLQWNMLKAMHEGGDFNSNIPIHTDVFKNPVLWLTQAEALTQAGITILQTTPEFQSMHPSFRALCDSQFCAAGLMLVGYSLEVALKGMVIMEIGIEAYKEIEKKKMHHRLNELSDFVPNLGEKDKAILRCLTFFIYWAGRYPDPGSGKEKEYDEIFKISEKHQISAKDLFVLAAKVMRHAKTISENTDNLSPK